MTRKREREQTNNVSKLSRNVNFTKLEKSKVEKTTSALELESSSSSSEHFPLSCSSSLTSFGAFVCEVDKEDSNNCDSDDKTNSSFTRTMIDNSPSESLSSRHLAVSDEHKVLAFNEEELNQTKNNSSYTIMNINSHSHTHLFWRVTLAFLTALELINHYAAHALPMSSLLILHSILNIINNSGKSHKGRETNATDSTCCSVQSLITHSEQYTHIEALELLLRLALRTPCTFTHSHLEFHYGDYIHVEEVMNYLSKQHILSVSNATDVDHKIACEHELAAIGKVNVNSNDAAKQNAETISSQEREVAVVECWNGNKIAALMCEIARLSSSCFSFCKEQRASTQSAYHSTNGSIENQVMNEENVNWKESDVEEEMFNRDVKKSMSNKKEENGYIDKKCIRKPEKCIRELERLKYKSAKEKLALILSAVRVNELRLFAIALSHMYSEAEHQNCLSNTRKRSKSINSDKNEEYDANIRQLECFVPTRKVSIIEYIVNWSFCSRQESMHNDTNNKHDKANNFRDKGKNINKVLPKKSYHQQELFCKENKHSARLEKSKTCNRNVHDDKKESMSFIFTHVTELQMQYIIFNCWNGYIGTVYFVNKEVKRVVVNISTLFHVLCGTVDTCWLASRSTSVSLPHAIGFIFDAACRTRLFTTHQFGVLARMVEDVLHKLYAEHVKRMETSTSRKTSSNGMSNNDMSEKLKCENQSSDNNNNNDNYKAVDSTRTNLNKEVNAVIADTHSESEQLDKTQREEEWESIQTLPKKNETTLQNNNDEKTTVVKTEEKNDESTIIKMYDTFIYALRSQSALRQTLFFSTCTQSVGLPSLQLYKSNEWWQYYLEALEHYKIIFDLVNENKWTTREAKLATLLKTYNAAMTWLTKWLTEMKSRRQHYSAQNNITSTKKSSVTLEREESRLRCTESMLFVDTLHSANVCKESFTVSSLLNKYGLLATHFLQFTPQHRWYNVLELLYTPLQSCHEYSKANDCLCMLLYEPLFIIASSSSNREEQQQQQKQREHYKESHAMPGDHTNLASQGSSITFNLYYHPEKRGKWTYRLALNFVHEKAKQRALKLLEEEHNKWFATWSCKTEENTQLYKALTMCMHLLLHQHDTVNKPNMKTNVNTQCNGNSISSDGVPKEIIPVNVLMPELPHPIQRRTRMLKSLWRSESFVNKTGKVASGNTICTSATANLASRNSSYSTWVALYHAISEYVQDHYCRRHDRVAMERTLNVLHRQTRKWTPLPARYSQFTNSLLTPARLIVHGVRDALDRHMWRTNTSEAVPAYGVELFVLNFLIKKWNRRLVLKYMTENDEEAENQKEQNLESIQTHNLPQHEEEDKEEEYILENEMSATTTCMLVSVESTSVNKETTSLSKSSHSPIVNKTITKNTFYEFNFNNSVDTINSNSDSRNDADDSNDKSGESAEKIQEELQCHMIFDEEFERKYNSNGNHDTNDNENERVGFTSMKNKSLEQFGRGWCGVHCEGGWIAHLTRLFFQDCYDDDDDDDGEFNISNAEVVSILGDDNISKWSTLSPFQHVPLDSATPLQFIARIRPRISARIDELEQYISNDYSNNNNNVRHAQIDVCCSEYCGNTLYNFIIEHCSQNATSKQVLEELCDFPLLEMLQAINSHKLLALWRLMFLSLPHDGFTYKTSGFPDLAMWLDKRQCHHHDCKTKVDITDDNNTKCNKSMFNKNKNNINDMETFCLIEVKSPTDELSTKQIVVNDMLLQCGFAVYVARVKEVQHEHKKIDAIQIFFSENDVLLLVL